jgi:hypothetical protein
MQQDQTFIPPAAPTDATRDSQHNFARDPSLRPPAASARRRRLVIGLASLQFMVLGAASYVYFFIVTPHLANAPYKTEIDLLAFLLLLMHLLTPCLLIVSIGSKTPR